jgi:hypothetical protein
MNGSQTPAAAKMRRYRASVSRSRRDDVVLKHLKGAQAANLMLLNSHADIAQR